MSRKKKKRQPKGPKKPASARPGAPASTSGGGNEEVLARKAGDCLKRGDYRRAMEGYKRLVKIDPDRYRDAFASSCGMAFEEFLRQAQPKSAEIVIGNLEGFVPASRLDALRLKLALNLHEEAGASRLALALLDDPDALPEAARFAADALIAIPPERRGEISRAEPGLIDRALDDAAAGRWAEVAAILRELPRTSPFAHWRIFFKAAAAHAEGDAGTAGRALAKLDGTCAAVARAWIAPDSDTLAAAVALHGEPKVAENLPALLRVDARSDYVAVFARLIEYCRDFPTVGASLAATLTDYLCACLGGRPLEERQFAQMSKRVKGAGAPPVARFIVGRFLFDEVLETPFITEAEVRLITNATVDVRAAFPEHADAVEAITLGKYTGMLLKRAIEDDLPFAPKLAAEWLARANRALPTWDALAVELINAYEDAKMTKECDASVLAALARFPENPGVLLKAGQIAFRRGRYDAALDYFREVLARDPLSSPTRREIIHAAIASCGHALQQQDDLAAKEAAALAIEHARDSLGGLYQPGRVLVQCGSMFELAHGPAGAAPYFERAAAHMSPGVLAYLRFLHARIGMKSPKEKRAPFKLPKAWAENATLFDVLPMLELHKELNKRMSKEADAASEDALASYLRAAVARDPDWRVNVVPLARQLLREDGFYELTEALYEAAAKRKPRDPVTVLLDVLVEPDPEAWKHLDKARAKLVKEGFTEAVALCDGIMKRCDEEAEGGGWGGGRGFDDVFGGGFGGGLDGFHEAFSKFSPEEIERAIEAMAARMGPSPQKKAAKKKAPVKKKAPAPKPSDGSKPGGPQLDLPF